MDLKPAWEVGLNDQESSTWTLCKVLDVIVIFLKWRFTECEKYFFERTYDRIYFDTSLVLPIISTVHSTFM